MGSGELQRRGGQAAGGLRGSQKRTQTGQPQRSVSRQSDSLSFHLPFEDPRGPGG